MGYDPYEPGYCEHCDEEKEKVHNGMCRSCNNDRADRVIYKSGAGLPGE